MTQETGRYYNFSNIRYGEPPVGSLRFAAPVAAKPDPTVQKGDVGRICPQARPAWGLIVPQVVQAILTGNLSALPEANASSTPSGDPSSLIPGPDPRETEDCLFLDVIVPKEAFDQKNKHKRKAPVLVWIYGGGYVFGDKNGNGDPAGLIERSRLGDKGPVIYVALNYRLGAYGWLGGPEIQANGAANAGLLDQRLALEWVRDHIEAFGGDRKRVTVFGQSAGGGSIMHQITAYGGTKGRVPFQQAVPQSPGWTPQTIPANLTAQLRQFLNAAKVKTIDEARRLPAEALRLANFITIGLAEYGDLVYGPSVDGTFVPDLPGKLLLQNKYDRDVTFMVGHNANEGLLFTSPFIRDDTSFRAFIQNSFPRASPAVIDTIAVDFYPPTFDGSAGYTNQIQRTALYLSEAVFTCNTVYLARASRNTSHNYLFSVPPALHGQDIPYTYFNNEANPAVLSADIAVALQTYLTRFAATGDPNGASSPAGLLPAFPRYGPDSKVLNLNITGIDVVADPAANERCVWWQNAFYEG
ncbi:MAG: hypothetical protein M1833_003721 [Piccolia ochrophora]|nr:MAG: hypothetical protein M1833_003721 [Piccolia ochrophora]